MNDKIFALDKRVSKVMANQSDSTSHILFCNSEGVMYYDYRPMVTLGAVCIMEENGKTENSYAARAYRKGFEFLSDDLVDILAREAVDNTAILFKAIKPKRWRDACGDGCRRFRYPVARGYRTCV